MPGVRFLDDLARLPDDHFDDIVYFGSRRQTIEEFNTKLGFQGIANIVTGGKEIGDSPRARKAWTTRHPLAT